jgi:uncharacterized protein YsxB (DUF464 family)
MIQVKYSSGNILVEGHAVPHEEGRASDGLTASQVGVAICASVTLLTQTLHAAYSAPVAKEGRFEWSYPISAVPVVSFVLNALCLLAEQHPQYVAVEFV